MRQGNAKLWRAECGGYSMFDAYFLGSPWRNLRIAFLGRISGSGGGSGTYLAMPMSMPRNVVPRAAASAAIPGKSRWHRQHCKNISPGFGRIYKADSPLFAPVYLAAPDSALRPLQRVWHGMCNSQKVFPRSISYRAGSTEGVEPLPTISRREPRTLSTRENATRARTYRDLSGVECPASSGLNRQTIAQVRPIFHGEKGSLHRRFGNADGASLFCCARHPFGAIKSNARTRRP